MTSTRDTRDAQLTTVLALDLGKLTVGVTTSPTAPLVGTPAVGTPAEGVAAVGSPDVGTLAVGTVAVGSPCSSRASCLCWKALVGYENSEG